MVITEQKTSDMVLAVLSLFREKLPCSENYWRYKRNYELHMKILAGESIKSRSPSPPNQMARLGAELDEEAKSDGGSKKLVAQAHMSFVRPLSPYNRDGKGFFKMSPSSSPRSFGSGSGSLNDLNDINMKEED